MGAGGTTNELLSATEFILKMETLSHCTLCEFHLHFKKVMRKRIQGEKTKEMKIHSAYLDLPESRIWTNIL